MRSIYKGMNVAFVDNTVYRRAQFLLGKDQPSSAGFLFKLTRLSNIDTSILIFQEEVFALGVGVSLFSSEQEVLALVNNTNIGLASYYFTKDMNRI